MELISGLCGEGWQSYNDSFVKYLVELFIEYIELVELFSEIFISLMHMCPQSLKC